MIWLVPYKKIFWFINRDHPYHLTARKCIVGTGICHGNSMKFPLGHGCFQWYSKYTRIHTVCSCFSLTYLSLKKCRKLYRLKTNSNTSGAYIQRQLHDYGRVLQLILMARRSRHFAGTRWVSCSLLFSSSHLLPASCTLKIAVRLCFLIPSHSSWLDT
jgi:hypothetical protein